MKKLLIIIISSFLLNVGFAQDSIIQINGAIIKAKVLEVNDVTIKYHVYDNLAGPINTIKKSEVLMIRYENGRATAFGQLIYISLISATKTPMHQISPKLKFCVFWCFCDLPACLCLAGRVAKKLITKLHHIRICASNAVALMKMGPKMFLKKII